MGEARSQADRKVADRKGGGRAAPVKGQVPMVPRVRVHLAAPAELDLIRAPCSLRTIKTVTEN